MSRTPATHRLPAFAPVPVKRRADGWTGVRQAGFVGMLAQTGSVRAAAEFVGMARETAYRLRRMPGAEEFARAWDVALAIGRGLEPAEGRRATPGDSRATVSPAKVTEHEHLKRLFAGRWRPLLRRGKFVGCVRESRNSEVFRLVAGQRQAILEAQGVTGGRAIGAREPAFLSPCRQPAGAELGPRPKPAGAISCAAWPCLPAPWPSL